MAGHWLRVLWPIYPSSTDRAQSGQVCRAGPGLRSAGWGGSDWLLRPPSGTCGLTEPNPAAQPEL